jgi:uncharacterized protein
MVDPVTEKIREYVRATLDRPGSHGLDHVERVTAMCERIGREEHADMGVLIPAALLHDIARPLEKERGIPHEMEGARMAEEFLCSIQYDDGRIPAITHAIRAHRYRSTEKPVSLEAQVLSDADKLDAMGAVGIARTFMRAGEHNGSIHDGIGHFHDKLLNLPDLMYTGTARRIAGERSAFLARFLEILEEELSVSQD